MPRSLRCPRCSTVITVQDGQAPVCPTCGFSGPAPDPTQAAAPAAAPSPPPAAFPSSPYGAVPPSPTPSPFSAPPAGFSSPPSGWGQPQGRTDGMAVASLVLGICGIAGPFLGGICALIALILGIQAMGRCKRDPTLKGHGMALAGTVLGAIFLVLWLLLILAFVGIIARGLRSF